MVDNLNIKSNLSGWHKKIGYVPQSVYLIDDTIRKNIAFGLQEENINDDLIQKAIEKGGSTLNDFFSVNGQSGYFQNEHNVYGRENESCNRCEGRICQLRIAQRSSFYCKRCQV